MKTILEVTNLAKIYGTYKAVDSVSFSIPKGKIIGFLGPNGAGKTTTIQMLLGITLPSSGSIKYFDKEFTKHRREILQRINFTSSFNTLQGRITAYENLLVFALLYNVKDPKKRINELADYFEIHSFMSTKYQDLSAGQKTRINLVKSLLNNPELILMDEPTASLDPDIADKTLSYIETLNKEQGLSILYTSHEMDEVTRICDEVIFLDKGKIVAHDTPLGLTKRIKNAELFLMYDATKTKMREHLEKSEFNFEFTRENQVIITLEEKEIPKVIFSMSKAEIMITDIEVKKPTLEDFFLQLARGGHDEK